MATLEDFFLVDYEKLRERVREPEGELEQLKPGKFGITDLGRNQELLNVDNVWDSYLKGAVKTSAKARELLANTNEELLAWALNTTCGYGDRVINVRRKTLPFTVEVTDLTSTHVYATDGRTQYVDIEYMEERMSDNLGNWCLPEYEEELTDAALSELRRDLEELADKYEREEQEASDD